MQSRRLVSFGLTRHFIPCIVTGCNVNLSIDDNVARAVSEVSWSYCAAFLRITFTRSYESHTSPLPTPAAADPGPVAVAIHSEELADLYRRLYILTDDLADRCWRLAAAAAGGDTVAAGELDGILGEMRSSVDGLRTICNAIGTAR